MKTKMLKTAKYATLLLLTMIIGYSCSDDPVVQQVDFDETQWEIVNVSIKNGDWVWDNAVGRYKAVVDLPELTKFVYEKGAQFGYVFIGKQGVNEVQKILPYVHTYWELEQGEEGEDDVEVLYTETISCDFMYGTPSTVAFYIQASDLGRDDSILSDYNFRVVLIW